MRVLFTDLDGTLLHPHTYSFEAAKPALEALQREGIPLVLCTSKTRSEVEFWRRRLGNADPFIVENGGAVYIPSGYFPFPVPEARERDGYEVVEFGTPYPELVETLRICARESGCEVMGFHDMSVAELAVCTLLPVRQAELAKQREYDEAFEIRGTGSYRLLEAIEAHGLRWTRGDRFYHITGPNDKAAAVRILTTLFARAFGSAVTVGVGDGHNDATFLNTVDIPVIVQSRFATALARAVPHSLVSLAPGPHGWNDAVLQVLAGAAFTAGAGAGRSLTAGGR